MIGIATFPPILLADPFWVYSTIIITLGLCLIGLFNSKEMILRIVYLVLVLGTLLTFFTPYLYELGILFGMVLYYQKVLNEKTQNAFNA
ncbi:hypothetical protein [Stygiolobus azoricus]|uniref:Uncharacterized protein n=1 Tax=Stygiolobus azoricus TaxID=41675 RepID=A0A650CL58_9CREN|nr:hypothetical protein [Stygiolobus azoricus]QGR18611.1 hypothetical protein D1868_00420 [Stygiolobus azoricus]